MEKGNADDMEFGMECSGGSCSIAEHRRLVRLAKEGRGICGLKPSGKCDRKCDGSCGIPSSRTAPVAVREEEREVRFLEDENPSLAAMVAELRRLRKEGTSSDGAWKDRVLGMAKEALGHLERAVEICDGIETLVDGSVDFGSPSEMESYVNAMIQVKLARSEAAGAQERIGTFSALMHPGGSGRGGSGRGGV